MKGPRKPTGKAKKQTQPNNMQLMQAIFALRLSSSQKAALRSLTAGMCDFAQGHMMMASKQLWKEAEEAKDPDKWLHVSVSMKAYAMVCEAMELPAGKKMFEEREENAMKKVLDLTETPPEPDKETADGVGDTKTEA